MPDETFALFTTISYQFAFPPIAFLFLFALQRYVSYVQYRYGMYRSTVPIYL
jgi:hypothetical protein